MKFSREQEVVDQIKEILNSNDLTDRQNFRGLYNEYLSFCEKAKERLDLCNRNLQQNMKAEAIAEVNRKPDLRELVQILNFPEKNLLLDLCDLYEWLFPPKMNTACLDQMQDVSQSYRKMRSLLDNYRAISRSDLHYDKLVLLREIIKNDPKNPEWLKTIKDVEVIYLKELLERAKADIQEERYEDLRAARKELLEEQWHIAIPAVVLEKINRVLEEYDLEQTKVIARDSLFKIDSAYSAHDFSALKLHLENWAQFCRERKYDLTENEQKQIQEAQAFLEEHRKMVAKQEHFDQTLARLVKRIEMREPLNIVEEDFVHLKSLELPIPEYLEDSIDQYRDEFEHESRMRTIGKAVKTVCITLVIVGVLAFVGYTSIKIFNEKQKENALKKLIENSQYEEAKAMYMELYQTNPSLAMSSGVKAQKLILDEWENQEQKRKEHFEKMVSNIRTALKNKQKFDMKGLKTLVEDVEQYAKTDEEKSIVTAIAIDADNRILEYKNRQEMLYRKQFQVVRGIKERFYQELETGKDLEKLRSLLAQFEAAANACKAVKDVSRTQEEEDFLKTAAASKELEKLREKNAEEKEFYAALANAKGFNELSKVLEKYNGLIGLAVDFGAIQNDLKVLRRIATAKADDLPDEPDLAQVSFFKDLLRSNMNAKCLEDVVSHFKKTSENFAQRSLDSNICQITFQPLMGKDPIYILYPKLKSLKAPHLQRTQNGYLFKDNKNFSIELAQQRNGRIILRRGLSSSELTEEYAGKIVFPEGKTRLLENINSKAVHMVLFETLNENRKLWTSEETPLKCIENMKMIRDKKYCLPYWKTKLIVAHLETIEKLDPVAKNTPVTSLKKRLQEYITRIDREGNEAHKLMNRHLEDNLMKIDFSDVETYVRQWIFDRKVNDLMKTENFCYLGVILKGQPIPKNFASADTIQASGDIFCLSEGRINRLHVGYFTLDGVHIFPEYQDKIQNRVLFTSRKVSDIRKYSKELEREAAQEKLKLNCPGFWPLKRKGN